MNFIKLYFVFFWNICKYFIFFRVLFFMCLVVEFLEILLDVIGDNIVSLYLYDFLIGF